MTTLKVLAPALLACGLLAAAAAQAIGPMSVPPGDGDPLAASSYTADALALRSGGDALELGDAAASGLPTDLYVVEAEGGVSYRPLGPGAWRVTIEVAERTHEQVDAVYDLVLALALPEGFRTDAWRIGVREGSPEASVPVVYAGEKVRLKRNLALEASWLPLLAAAGSGLPDLSDRGYVWTLWDTIVRYDAEAGPSLQGFAAFDYRADPSVPAPDPEDPRSAAYVISWVPSLDAAVAPYTLRLDAVAPQEE